MIDSLLKFGEGIVSYIQDRWTLKEAQYVREDLRSIKAALKYLLLQLDAIRRKVGAEEQGHVTLKDVQELLDIKLAPNPPPSFLSYLGWQWFAVLLIQVAVMGLTAFTTVDFVRRMVFAQDTGPLLHRRCHHKIYDHWTFSWN